ncbi:transcriptional regulator [Subtercola vilae]|uniref:Transcriptional regulator n=1 Tax=Subtercola vilae TaxID=2056433 RepID=A0A4T2BXY8_9MICO|nr:transcriptional regulator [Subtercola vilae]
MGTSLKSAAPTKRIRFQDVKPYDAPEQLEDLRGPASGALRLPPWIYWGPNPAVDLSALWGATKAYQATIQEGTVEDQVKILNRDVLISVWAELNLPPRARQLWESRFPELTARTSPQPLR